jgi:arylsulfatase A-like enzyme
MGLLSPFLGRSQAAVGAGLAEGLLLPDLLGLGRRLTDRDRDGYSASFQGGDCNDADPGIHPGAVDRPGNGVDENCEGGDASPAATRPRARPASRKGPRFDGNLLLICIDTLRADRLGVMGNRRGLTPNLDRLASQSVLFTQVYAQGPNTPQSFPSIFTSRYPSRVPFRKTFVGYPELTDEAVTFFESMKQANIRTAAVTSHFYFTTKRGITQGVEDWDNRDATNLRDSNKDVASPRIVPRAVEKLRALASEKRRFALFVHLFEPHSTYVTHPGDPPVTERGGKALEQKYDYEVRFVDRWLGKLLEGLHAAGLEKNTAVLVFGDHAEAFREHGLYFHGQTLYNECLHVPLMLRLPGGPRRVVRERVALLDLAPTLLELMGVEVPASFQGLSLLPLVHGTGAWPGDRRIGAVLLAYPAWPKAQQAVWSGRYKAIQRITENRFEVYDLEKDPGEQRDLSGSDPELAARLRRELTRFAEQELQ